MGKFETLVEALLGWAMMIAILIMPSEVATELGAYGIPYVLATVTLLVDGMRRITEGRMR